MDYNTLLCSLPHEIVIDTEADLPENMKGLYVEQSHTKIILLSKNIETDRERKCVLAEEIGHYESTVGDILDQDILINRKQELTARRIAYEKLLPLDQIIAAHETSTTYEELLDILDVTHEFYDEAMNYYNNKHGIYTEYKGYFVKFNPFSFEKIS